jgi:hypothetical protein
LKVSPVSRTLLICIANNQILANPQRILLSRFCHEGVDGSLTGCKNGSDDLPPRRAIAEIRQGM